VSTAPAPRIGRFAPTPSGPLHLGSLASALASFLDARAHDGRWLVRIEDLDTPRMAPGAEADILRTLEAHGLTWDGPVLRQSARVELYDAALAQLVAAGHGYPCACSRREIADSATEGVEGLVYPGTCREGLQGREARALRVRTDALAYAFDDESQGVIQQDIEHEVGDFVVKRADGPFAYQLAVVVDDAAQGVTHVVRGADLLLSTPRQLHLQRLLGLPTPRYRHHPVAVDAAGAKLSKSAGAAGLDPAAPGRNLMRALGVLRQAPPPALIDAAPAEVLDWAAQHYDPDRYRGVRAVADIEE
jgi:glutamyl-Q tRNA(Asp) synthetase